MQGFHVVSVGSLTASLVHPREVYKAAIVANAAAIIALHNHPSGDPTPSIEDHAITRRLKEAGELLGIPPARRPAPSTRSAGISPASWPSILYAALQPRSPGGVVRSVTREFVRERAHEKLAEATCARTYASVRHFARWIHQKARPFPLGCPTDGIKPPREPEPEWKGLSRADELRLITAAQTLRLSPGRGTNQGLRDQAVLAVLLGSGLRVTELVNLDRSQYTGRGFTKVLVKGGRVRDVAVQRDAREILDEWLRDRGDTPGPLFPTRTGERLTRVQVYRILQRIAAQANTHLASEQRITVSPHDIWRYVKPSMQGLADALDELA